MIIRNSRDVALRSRAQSLAARERIDLDSAVARVAAASAAPSPGSLDAAAALRAWRGEPRLTSWDELCSTSRLDDLCSAEHLAPGFDLTAYLAARSVDVYGLDEAVARLTGQGSEQVTAIRQFFDAALIYRTGRFVVIALQGTRVQWLSNFAAVPVGTPARHWGFDLGWHRVRPGIEAWLEQHYPADGELLITGHSRGGAMAVLAGFELSDRYPVRAVVTIGAPRVGLGRFQQDYAQKRRRPGAGADAGTLGEVTVRLSHQNDLVPRIPPPPYFRHIGEAFQIDGAGRLTPGESETTVSRLSSWVDSTIGNAYATVRRWRTPDPPPIPSWLRPPPALRTVRTTPPGPGAAPLVHQSTAGVRPVNPILVASRMPPQAPAGNLSHLSDDFQSLQAKVPPLQLVGGYVVLGAMAVVSAIFAAGVVGLGILDGLAHKSPRYIAALRRRYGGRP